MEFKYSIIIPIYNAEKYLRKSLDSALYQDYDNFEVICVNDGSTDTSLDILNEYANSHANLFIINQENRGPSFARNQGISNAKGDYILFLDSDDYYYHLKVLSELSSVIIEKDVDCVYYPGGCVTPEWAEKESYQLKQYNKGWDCLNECCITPRILVFGSVYTQCYKREVLLENNLFFDEELVYAEDRLFVISFFYYAKKTIIFPEPLYCYNVHDGSLMKNNNNTLLKIRNEKKCTELIYKFCALNKISEYKVIYTYINGFYISSVLDEYKQYKKVSINKTMLFSTSIGKKKIFQSLLLIIHPFLYLIYKRIAIKVLILFK